MASSYLPMIQAEAGCPRKKFISSFVDPIPIKVTPKPNEANKIEVLGRALPASFYRGDESSDILGWARTRFSVSAISTALFLVGVPLLCVIGRLRMAAAGLPMNAGSTHASAAKRPGGRSRFLKPAAFRPGRSCANICANASRFPSMTRRRWRSRRFSMGAASPSRCAGKARRSSRRAMRCALRLIRSRRRWPRTPRD